MACDRHATSLSFEPNDDSHAMDLSMSHAERTVSIYDPFERIYCPFFPTPLPRFSPESHYAPLSNLWTHFGASVPMEVEV